MMIPTHQPPGSVTGITLSRDIVGWEVADRLVHNLRHFDEGVTGEGSRPTPARLICSTLALMLQLREGRVSPPDRLYALPDGNIMLEWFLEGGGMMRLEVEGEGCGQVMVTRPTTRAEFVDLRWEDTAWWKSKVWGNWKPPQADVTPRFVAAPDVVTNSYTLAA